MGPSGCAGLFRMSALRDIKMQDSYFDPIYFMYKEDIDLAYRLFLAGWQVQLVWKARAYHDRSSGVKKRGVINFFKSRKEKNKDIKQWSFWGQQILILKYWPWQNFYNKLAIIWRELKMFFFIIIWERYLFTEIKKVLLDFCHAYQQWV